ncbi:MAG: hypothetical protein SFV54_08200 [Bryobacteraceae bacterium]|nr:hypothetical protein [Bryobacteraceae bacterium]
MRLLFAALAALMALAQQPGTRVLLDAHNCYPYEGKWPDRIDRALQLDLPIAIEQDLYWHVGRSVVAHDKPQSSDLPDLKTHFFERIRPLVEKALAEPRRDQWPLIVLNLDFKTNEPEHHAAVWNTLGEYEAWLTTAPKKNARSEPEPLEWGPVLVLTGAAADQEVSFYEQLREGDRLRLFGAAATVKGQLPGFVTNYRRWWNNPWSVVEEGGQPKAGAWTKADQTRLNALVAHARKQGLWLRFYTLNGHTAAEGVRQGWSKGYNFGSLEAARLRWKAAIAAGVDFIATDQYEEFAAELAKTPR